jgi:Sulfotransferase family
MTISQTGPTVAPFSEVRSKRTKLPGALIIGATKSGTTTLFDYLRRHPQIYPSPVKEPSFFSFPASGTIPPPWLFMCGFYHRRWRRDFYQFLVWCGFFHKTGPRKLDPFALPEEALPAGLTWDKALPYYQSLFASAGDEQICLEASTDYTRWPQIPEVPPRIASMLPDVKFIYLMRHPIDRAYSHFVHNVLRLLGWKWKGKTLRRPSELTFEAYIEGDPSFLDSSNYMMQIEQYLQYFPKEQFLFLFLDDLDKDPQSVLRKVFEFLDIEDRSEAMMEAPIRSNVGVSAEDRLARRWIARPFDQYRVLRRVARLIPRRLANSVGTLVLRSPYGQRMRAACRMQKMRPETRQMLIERFREPNRRLSEFLGVDLSHWNC